MIFMFYFATIHSPRAWVYTIPHQRAEWSICALAMHMQRNRRITYGSAWLDEDFEVIILIFTGRMKGGYSSKVGRSTSGKYDKGLK